MKTKASRENELLIARARLYRWKRSEDRLWSDVARVRGELLELEGALDEARLERERAERHLDARLREAKIPGRLVISRNDPQ